MLLLLLFPSINLKNLSELKGINLETGWRLQHKGELPASYSQGASYACTAVVTSTSKGVPFSMLRYVSSSGCGPTDTYFNFISLVLDFFVYLFSFVLLYKIIKLWLKQPTPKG